MSDKVDCPYCERENEIQDLYDLLESGTEFDCECSECGKEFEVSVEFEPSLSAQKIKWVKCDSCKKDVRSVTSTGQFSSCPDKLKGLKICDACIRKELGYK